MKPEKLDPALLTEIQSDASAGEQRLPVFVRTAPLSRADVEAISTTLGTTVNEGATIFSADVSKRQVNELSEQNCVKLIRLARAARPLLDK